MKLQPSLPSLKTSHSLVLPKRKMHSNVILKWSLLAVGFVGIIFFPDISIFRNNTSTESVSHNDSQEPQIAIAEQVRSGLPIRLKIPTIKVDAEIVYVGLTTKGAMDVPKGPAEVAWFNLGPRPGENGSAVMAGHFGWKNKLPAVFDNLYKLKKGDKLTVEDEKGVTMTFVVRESRSYDPKADSSEVFISSDGVAHLNLITCEGFWNKASQSYSKRLVVFTDKE